MSQSRQKARRCVLCGEECAEDDDKEAELAGEAGASRNTGARKTHQSTKLTQTHVHPQHTHTHPERRPPPPNPARPRCCCRPRAGGRSQSEAAAAAATAVRCRSAMGTRTGCRWRSRRCGCCYCRRRRCCCYCCCRDLQSSTHLQGLRRLPRPPPPPTLIQCLEAARDVAGAAEDSRKMRGLCSKWALRSRKGAAPWQGAVTPRSFGGERLPLLLLMPLLMLHRRPLSWGTATATATADAHGGRTQPQPGRWRAGRWTCERRVQRAVQGHRWLEGRLLPMLLLLQAAGSPKRQRRRQPEKHTCCRSFQTHRRRPPPSPHRKAAAALPPGAAAQTLPP